MKTKAELYAYLAADKRALNISRARPRLVGDEIWRFEILLRKREYYSGVRSPLGRLLYAYYSFRWQRACVRLGFSIPMHVFGPGLSIAHRGTIVVNGNARVGAYCRLQECVTIGATGGEGSAPRLGDYVYLGSGARVIGDIDIANSVCVGAGAVVVKSCTEENATLAGVPARVVSRKGSHPMMPWLFEAQK